MTAQEALSLRKQLIENNHSVKIEASGYSMFPFLRKGDLQTISPVPIEDIQVGDVVVFEHINNWISHRVIAIQRTNNEISLTLRGDTCMQIDSPVTRENYIGKTVSFERAGKVFFIDSLRKKNNRIVLLGVIRGAPLYIIKMIIMKLKTFSLN
jgi:signal peptidase